MNTLREIPPVPKEILDQMEVLKWIRYASKELQNLPKGGLSQSMEMSIRSLLESPTYVVVDKKKFENLLQACDDLAKLANESKRTVVLMNSIATIREFTRVLKGSLSGNPEVSCPSLDR